MKQISVTVSTCFECPYCDGFWHNDEEGLCCKSEREVDDINALPDWCELDDTDVSA